jgi:hypothetical protein
MADATFVMQSEKWGQLSIDADKLKVQIAPKNICTLPKGHMHILNVAIKNVQSLENVKLEV